MDSCREKVFPTNTSAYQNIYRLKHKPSGEAPTRTMSDDSDDLQQDRLRSRTILESSCSTCDISVAHSKNRPHLGACRSLHPTFNDTSSSDKYSRKSQSLTEQYWACAIPNTPPPRPDRTSPRWDPNKEYQDLLDYTYPLNPKYFINKEDEADAFLQDSGVDLDSYNVSSNSKFDSFNTTYRENNKVTSNRYLHANNQSSPFAFSTPLLERTGYHGLQHPPGSSNETSCGEFSPYASKSDLAKVCTTTILSPSRYDALDKFSEDECSRDYSGQFLPTTSVLPHHNDLDTDEEYLSLPPTLKELETLAAHLKDLSLAIGDKNQGSGAKVNDIISEDGPEDPEYISDFYSHDECKMNRFSSLRDMLDGRVSAEVLDMSGCAPVKENNSLVQRIQRFCQHLDKLIEWLYSVAEVTENWTAPKPNVESIQIALSLYLKLRKDVADQQVLANTVMKDGESLVRSLTLNSSVLKDTLTLISKQSGELDRHTERLYASVLEAMDTITEQSLARNGNLKQHVSLEMESS